MSNVAKGKKTTVSPTGSRATVKGRSNGAAVIEKKGPEATALTITLESTTKSLQTCRERVLELLKENESLQDRLKSQELDALEIITSLRRENDVKDEEKRQLQAQYAEEIARHKKEKTELMEMYESRILGVQDTLAEKETQFKMMQQELVDIKDFRKKRQEMIKDLEIQKAEVLDLERRHKESITRMEKKFFEEKLRLQKDANRKISDLALKAHKEAVSNLNETTKSVYRENLRMVEALRHHVLLGEELEKANTDLQGGNKRLLAEKEMHDIIIREKIVQSKYHDLEMKTLQSKLLSMEHSLTHIVQEFEREREILAAVTHKELEEVKRVADVLRENLRKKTSEMKYIKKLALHIIQQRTDLERFFMDSLEYVRQEMVADEEQQKKYRLEAIIYPEKKLATALNATPAGKGTSAAVGRGRISKADLHQLGWADRERILRLLFAKMNGLIPTKSSESLADIHSPFAREEEAIVEAFQPGKLNEQGLEQAIGTHESMIRESFTTVGATTAPASAQ